MIYTDEKLLHSHISELMMGEDIDFVAYAISSHWHAMGVDALAYNISQRKKEKPSGVVVIGANPIYGFVISEEDFICQSFATVRFFFLDRRSEAQELVVFRRKELLKKGLNILLGIEAIRSKSKRYGKEIHIASILKPNIGLLQIFRDRRLASKYYPMFSSIDEGMGTYFPNKLRGLLEKILERKKGVQYFNLARFLEAKARRVSYRLLGIIALRYINTENLFLFHKERGKLIPNESVVNSYRYVIEKRGELHEKTEKTRPVAIVMTQAFSDSGQVPLIFELHLIETVIDILVQTGFDIVIKPHPLETIDKYQPVLTKFQSEGVRLPHHIMPVESLFLSLDPDCVIGYTSTALVTAKTLNNIPAITIIDMLAVGTNDELIRLSRSEFKKLTAEICYSADTFEKLKDILSSIKVK